MTPSKKKLFRVSKEEYIAALRRLPDDISFEECVPDFVELEGEEMGENDAVKNGKMGEFLGYTNAVPPTGGGEKCCSKCKDSYNIHGCTCHAIPPPPQKECCVKCERINNYPGLSKKGCLEPDCPCHGGGEGNSALKVLLLRPQKVGELPEEIEPPQGLLFRKGCAEDTINTIIRYLRSREGK